MSIIVLLMRLLGLVAVMLQVATATAFASPARVEHIESCIVNAAQSHGLPALVVAGVAYVESRMNPKAMNQTHVARTQSFDIGLMQINSRHLPMLRQRFGITHEALLDPCTNASVGAYLLRELFDRKGFTWDAVGANNAACTQLKGADCLAARSDYTWKVFKAMQKLAPRFSTLTGAQLITVASLGPEVTKPKRIARVTLEQELDENQTVAQGEASAQAEAVE